MRPITRLFILVVFLFSTGCTIGGHVVTPGDLLEGLKRIGHDLGVYDNSPKDPENQYRWGSTYESRGGEINYTEAVYWYRKAAEQGYVDAQFSLGGMYDNGKGVEQDDEQAVYWYRKAAEQGHAKAQNDLGFMYATGAGIEEDSKKAVYWFRKAAEQGYARAQSNLGLLYRKGEGVQQSYGRAVYWLSRVQSKSAQKIVDQIKEAQRKEKAARRGNAVAQFNLGEVYESGRGFGKSDEQASIWYVKAALQGHTDARTNLQRMLIGGKLTQQKGFSLGGVITKESKAGRNSTKRKVSNANMVATVREYEKTIRTILELGPIPTPSLPSLQKYEQNVFESQEEFKARIAKVRDARKRQIESIQRGYREQVEARNQRVKNYDVKRDFYRNIAIALAVEKLYGMPVLHPTTNAQGALNYDAESKAFSMALVFSEDSAFKRNISSVFPGSKSAESFYKKLGEGETLPLQVDFQIDTKGNIELEQVVFDWQSAAIASTAVKTVTDNSSDKLAVVLGQKGQEGQVRSMLQNPIIPDKEFDVWLAQEQKEYDDDIPELLERHRQAKVDKRKWLFVIGAGEYKETSDILHSRRSAELFAKVASKILGIAPSRSVVLLDKDATSGSIEGQLKGMLRKIKGGDTLYFYYSGHGVPVRTEDDAPYMLATDHVPDFIHENDYFRLENIYQTLSKSGAKVVAFVDSCFSGRTDDASVFGSDKGAVRLKPKALSISTDGQLAVITAGTGEQFSNALPSRGHRLFSYYLMKAMLKGHTKVSTLYDNVSSEVHKESLNLGGLREQKPVLQGNRNLTL